MILKDKSISIQGIRPELLYAIIVANDVYKEFNQELVITSLNDGRHSSTSLHYSGCAADFRTRYFAPGEAQEVTKKLDEKLGIDYDVILESDHIHLEYQPRRR